MCRFVTDRRSSSTLEIKRLPPSRATRAPLVMRCRLRSRREASSNTRSSHPRGRPVEEAARRCSCNAQHLAHSTAVAPASVVAGPRSPAVPVLTSHIVVLHSHSMAAGLYQKLRDDLEHQIRTGALAPGAKLPTEAELQHQYSVSRGTAQRAVDELARAGLVLRRRRHGTVVVDQTRQENLLRFTDPLVSPVSLPGRHVVRAASVITSAEVPFEMPGVAPDTPVILLERQKLDAEDAPIGMEWSAVPFTLTPRLLDEDLAELHLLPYFQRLGLPVEKTRLYLDPFIVDADTATLTGCSPAIAALRRRRHTWLADGRLVEAGIYFTRPGLMEFYVEQSVNLA